VIANQVECDPHQPGAYAAIAAKLIAREMSLEEAILGNGIGGITVGDGERHELEHLRLV